MTLRHRLLLLYGIVVLLNMGTVGVALYELVRARQVFGGLQLWHEIVLTAQKLKSGFPPEDQTPAGREAFANAISHYPRLNAASAYLNTDAARLTLKDLHVRYIEWAKAGPAATPEQTAEVRWALDRYTSLVERELDKLNGQAARQDRRIIVLVGVVGVMTVAHLSVIAWLLRRWLLRPMEQLNRQVEALGRDEPPAEPLLSRPFEMANLAQGLDRARRSLGTLRERLIEAERLTTIGQLAAQLAHNLRNPLASIRAAAQVTARQNFGETSRADAVASSRQRMDEIINSVDRLNQWIAGLMEVARREPAPAPPGDVVPTLYRIREALAAELAAKDLTLELDIPDEGLVCFHDPATLEHALIAMVINAIEASPLGETITVRGERLPANGRGTVCRIGIRDHGPGFPAAVAQRLSSAAGQPGVAEPLVIEFPVSTKQQGMGLGLSLARQALQRQGGSTRVENHPDGGALVYIELPAG